MAVGEYTLQQVTRHLEDGSTVYANKPEGSYDPLEEELVWTEEPDDPPVGYETYDMSVATSGTRGMAVGEPWGQCYICRYDYPLSEMVESHGRYYCKEQGCSEDLL